MKRRKKKATRDEKVKRNLVRAAATAAVKGARLKRGAPWHRLDGVAAAAQRGCAHRSSPVRSVR
jgi:hypothetical protein